MSPGRIGVVGGGPAGGFCALLLSRAGFPVILFEAAETVQRKVCGEYLAPAAAAIFERAGMPGFLSERFSPLDGITFFPPDGRRVETRFPTVGGRPSSGYALDRVAMEEAFLKLAREAGAEMRMGCRVRGVEPTAGGWEVHLENGAKEAVALLIGADGRRSAVAKSLGLHENRPTSHVALHGFFPRTLREPRRGQMHFFEDGSYAGLNASPAGNVNVSLVCDAGRLKELGGAEKAMAHYLGLSPALRAEVAGAGEAAVQTTYPVGHSVSRCDAARAVLIGDAGGLIDPLTGEGIYIALWSALTLVEQIKKWANRGDVAPHLREFARMKEREFRWKNRLSGFFQWVLRRPGWMNGIAAYLRKKPERADAFIGMMGHLYSPSVGMRKILASSTSRSERWCRGKRR